MLSARVRRIGLVAGLALLLGSTPALAHEHVIVGDYEFTVGWLAEPVIAGEINGLELFVAPAPPEGSEEGHQEEAAGVTGLEDSLDFTVEYGGESRSVPLEPAFDQPGGYEASFLPSQPGQYTFHFTGSVNDQPVDVLVEAEAVGDPADVSFPVASTASGLANKLATTQTIAILAALLGAASIVMSLTMRRRS